MPESRDDARDNLTILMLADQYVGSRATIACRNHELLRVPKREDDVPALPVQCIHLLVALRVHPHGSPQPSNHRSPDRRKHRKFQPRLYPLQGKATHPAHPGTALHEAAGIVPLVEGARHASPLRQSSLGPAP